MATAKQIKRAIEKTGEALNLKAMSEERIEELKALRDTLSKGVYTVAMLDIEATSLNASFGYVLCAGLKPIGQKPTIFRIDKYPTHKKQPWNDKQLVIDVRDAIEEFDIIVGWNSTWYDLPFIDQRLTVHDKRRIGPVHHIDLLPVARKKLRMHSNRLDAVAETLEVPVSKTGLKPAVWQRAAAGDPEALAYVVEHNRIDLEVTERVFGKMKDYVDAIWRKQ